MLNLNYLFITLILSIFNCHYILSSRSVSIIFSFFILLLEYNIVINTTMYTAMHDINTLVHGILNINPIPLLNAVFIA